jgi:hypothetical protein
MDPINSNNIDEQPTIVDPLADLEKLLINHYLEERGYKWCELAKLPAQEIKTIMTEACMYASARLAEIEAKVDFRQDIRYK